MPLVKHSASKERKPWIPPGRGRAEVLSTKPHYQTKVLDGSGDATVILKKVDGIIPLVDTNISTVCVLPDDIHIHITAIKDEVKLLKKYVASINPMLKFLLRTISSCSFEDRKIQNMILKIQKNSQDFDFQFEELECSLIMVENAFDSVNRTEECTKIAKYKEVITTRFLECYANLISIFQSLVEKHCVPEIRKSSFQLDSLKSNLQNSEKKCVSQEAIIKDAERRMSILKSKCISLEDYKILIENRKAELEKELQSRDKRIKYLTAEISNIKEMQTQEICADCEKLVEEVTRAVEIADEEKKAFKKALKVRKVQICDLEHAAKKLQKDVKEKDRMASEIATQRDHLKRQLTVANNNLIDEKSLVEKTKNQKLGLQNEIEENELSFRKKLYELSDAMNKKCKEVEDLERCKTEFEHNEKVMSARLAEVENALQVFKSRPNEKQYLQESRSSTNTFHGETNELIALLREVNKNVTHVSTNGAVLQDINELQSRYETCLKENEDLKYEIDEMKKAKFPYPQNQGYSAPETENGSFQNVQMDQQMKFNEVWRLRQQIKGLERDLEEVKDRLKKKEIECHKVSVLEEELYMKKKELAILEKKKDAESERLLTRTKELQNALDEMTSKHESLTIYVQKLRTSYLNVFSDHSSSQ